MIKFRAKRFDNGEMIQGPIASIKLGGLYPISVYPGTLEQYINGEWMKPETVDRLKKQRDGLLAVLKDLENNGDLDSFDMDFVREAIAEAEAK